MEQTYFHTTGALWMRKFRGNEKGKRRKPRLLPPLGDGSGKPSQKEPGTVVKIRPTSQWRWLDFRELWHYRDLLWTLAARDLRLRYRQTVLGIVWVVFQPVVGAGVFSFVFGGVAGLASGKHNYFMFSLAGLLLWNAFQSSLGKSSMALLGNAPLVSKVYFPRLLLPLSTLLSTLVDFGISFGVFLAAGLLSDWRPDWLALSQLPIWLGCVLASATGAGLLCAALMTRFRDIQHALPMLLTFLMYASPIAYGKASVPGPLQRAFEWNPLAWMLEGSRAALLGSDAVPWPWGAYAVGVSLVLLFAGIVVFRRMERNFADVI